MKNCQRRMALSKLIATLLIYLFNNSNVYAKDLSADGKFLFVANRVLDVSIDAEQAFRGQVRTLSMSSIPWLKAQYKSDPVFKGVQFILQITTDPAVNYWSDKYYQYLLERYSGAGHVPAEVRFPGYETYLSRFDPADVWVVPTTGYREHFLRCRDVGPHARDPEIGFCSLYARYPYDNDLVLIARIWRPDLEALPERVNLLATRMRGIIRCIDVTEAFQAGRQPQDAKLTESSHPGSYNECAEALPST